MYPILARTYALGGLRWDTITGSIISMAGPSNPVKADIFTFTACAGSVYSRGNKRTLMLMPTPLTPTVGSTLATSFA